MNNDLLIRCLDALINHTVLTRPIEQTDNTIAELQEALWAPVAQTHEVSSGARIPNNVITHRHAWRKALELAMNDAAIVQAPDMDDQAYWVHELVAFDRTFDRLQAMMTDSSSETQVQLVTDDNFLHCDITPRPLDYPLTDYHCAPSEGPLNSTWEDKPHRLIYDLVAAVKWYALERPALASAPEAYAVYWGIGEMRKNSVHFERETAEDSASQIKSITEIRPLYAHPNVDPPVPTPQLHWTTSDGTRYTFPLWGVTRLLADLYSEWPGGLEEIRIAMQTKVAQTAPEAIAYGAQNILNGKFSYVWHELSDVEGWVKLEKQYRQDIPYKVVPFYVNPDPHPASAALIAAAHNVLNEFGTSSRGLRELYQALKSFPQSKDSK